MNSDTTRLRAIIIVGHSNAGKSILCNHLVKNDRRISFSRSATTRPMRSNEKPSQDYLHLSKKQFEEFIKKDMFIEYDLQNTSHYYGTLKNEVQRINHQNHTALFDVNPNGANKLLEYFGNSSIGIFVTVPGNTLEEKQEVLRKRALDSVVKDDFERRLARVQDELRWAEQKKIDHWIINDDLNKSCQHLLDIVAHAKRQLRNPQPSPYSHIAATGGTLRD